ncbi:unnamed protein product [Coffea canephora]|uniref:Epidermal patterning factor-like protein n=1 Tax=Coffea canephora TaxID=49390 RepID=A0A068TS80_COFCA|nr:unnamed protein product [Coffea canephora]
MAVIRHRHRHRSLSFATISALLFLLLSSVSALTFNHARQFSKAGGMELIKRVLYRRRLTGPGSSPPTCRSKCGSCAPCKPVHVPIQPGLSRPLEYYPEAWRCKCGNKLFLP